MFLLRRAAVRTLSTPSTSFISKPRSITTFTPASFKLRQQPSIGLTFQRRFASDNVEKSESAETFAQTAAEAPVTETATETSATETRSTAASATESATEYVKEKASDAFDALGLGGASSAVPPRQSPRAFSSVNPVSTPNRTLYIGNLFFEVTEDQLKRVFSRFGTVEIVKIVTDSSGMSRGFGYVTFENIDNATTAIENLNQQVFEGRRMNVQYHVPRERRIDNSLLHTPRVSNPPSKTLFIGNLSFEMSDKDLNDLFRDIRNVMDVRVAIDRRSGQPRGFAHADFIDIKSAETAKAVLEGKEIYGRKLRIDYSARSSQTRTPQLEGSSI